MNYKSIFSFIISGHYIFVHFFVQFRRRSGAPSYTELTIQSAFDSFFVGPYGLIAIMTSVGLGLCLLIGATL